jgi:hypothetical protein
MTRRARRALTFLGLLAALVLGVAAPAGAHSTSGPPSSNIHGVVDGVRPAVAGVGARLAPDGERVEIHVTGPARVTVLGYQGEPYLRVTAHGVFENRSSPAVVLNRTRVPTGAPHQGPIRPPRWVRISDGATARWHDHRAHWMGGATPAVVRRDPDRAHVIGTWRIPIRVDGAPGAVTGSAAGASAVVGSIDWSPPPNALLWLGLAVLLAAVVLAGTRVRARPTLLVALAVLAIAESVHLWGAWPFSTADAGGRVGENLPSIAAVASAVLAFAWLARRTVYSAAPLLVIAGLFTAVAGGFADLPVLSHAWVPSRLDPDVARTLVVVALGVGVGVAIAGAMRLRPSARPARPAAPVT